MDHKANCKEIEEAWVELANCVCNTEVSMPCLHCDSDAFKVWYQMKFGVAAFRYVWEHGGIGDYCPLVGLRYKLLNLPYSLLYEEEEKRWLLLGGSKYFKTVKAFLKNWRSVIQPTRSLE